jgi:hypothetical protein
MAEQTYTTNPSRRSMLRGAVGIIPIITGIASVPLICAAAQSYDRIMALDTRLAATTDRLEELRAEHLTRRDPPPIETYWRSTDGIAPQQLTYRGAGANGQHARIYTPEGIERFRRIADRDFSQVGWMQMPSAAVEREVRRAKEIVEAYDAWSARNHDLARRLGIRDMEIERDRIIAEQQVALGELVETPIDGLHDLAWHAKLGLDFDDEDTVWRVAHQLVRLARIAN